MTNDVHNAASSLPFSAAVRAGDFVFVSGQLAFSADGTLSTGPIEEQTKIVLDGLKATIEAQGCSMSDVVNCVCSLQDARDFSGFNSVYATYFPQNPPARTTHVATHVLDARVEIACTVYKPVIP
jgi:2-iminobutanoate/2-iminopropanoate deaminase